MALKKNRPRVFFSDAGAPLTATVYKAKYSAHLKFIMDFEKKTRDANIIPRLFKHMLKVAWYVILN